MDDFVSWLQTIDGGKESLCRSKKHKGVLIGIVTWNPDKNTSYKNLDGWTSFHVMAKERRQLKQFWDLYPIFFHFFKIKENNTVKDECTNRLKEIIKNWNSNWFKSIQLRKYDKQLNDMKCFPAPAKMKSLDESEETRPAKKALAKFIKDKNWK